MNFFDSFYLKILDFWIYNSPSKIIKLNYSYVNMFLAIFGSLLIWISYWEILRVIFTYSESIFFKLILVIFSVFIMYYYDALYYVGQIDKYSKFLPNYYYYYYANKQFKNREKVKGKNYIKNITIKFLIIICEINIWCSISEIFEFFDLYKNFDLFLLFFSLGSSIGLFHFFKAATEKEYRANKLYLTIKAILSLFTQIFIFISAYNILNKIFSLNNTNLEIYFYFCIIAIIGYTISGTMHWDIKLNLPKYNYNLPLYYNMKLYIQICIASVCALIWWVGSWAILQSNLYNINDNNYLYFLNTDIEPTNNTLPLANDIPLTTPVRHYIYNNVLLFSLFSSGLIIFEISGIFEQECVNIENMVIGNIEL